MTTLAACEPIAFLATRNPAQARAFYADLLGLPLVGDDLSALVFDANGVTLRIAKVASLAPARHTVFGWRVADIGAMVDTLARAGISIERFAGLVHDDRGICILPDGTRVAWFKDPDGNLLSLTQPTHSAERGTASS